MSDKEKEYFIPEQLEDDDFEKEKIEEKRLKKERKKKKVNQSISDDENINSKIGDKKKTIRVIFMVIVIILLLVGAIWWYITPHEKKASEPEQLAKDFCAYFNSGNWKKINDYLDFKGYYIMGVSLKEEEYPKFDTTYKKFDEQDEKYVQFQTSMSALTNIDDETLGSVANIQIKINNIEACNKIQGTETLYKLRIDFNYIYNGQSQQSTGIIYVSNASGKYKIVFGDWIETILNFYYSIYNLQNSYGY